MHSRNACNILLGFFDVHSFDIVITDQTMPESNIRIEWSPGLQHAEDDMDELSHDGANYDFAVLRLLCETLGEPNNDRIALHRDQRGHVKRLSHSGASYLAQS